MKKIKFKIIWVLVWMFLLVWIVYATEYHITTRTVSWPSLSCPSNTSGNCFKSNNNWTWIHYYRWDKGRRVRNTHSTNDYFVPTKTTTEWYAFINHIPSWITLSKESYIWLNSTESINNYFNKAKNTWHIAGNSHIDVCLHWKCVNWYSKKVVPTSWPLTYDIRYVTYLKKSWNHYVRWSSSNWDVRRGALYRTTGVRKYYYVIEK